MTTFTVTSPGPMTTIQDAGRSGQHDLGLTEGGAMDFRSYALANRLAGNVQQCPALEITLGGLTLKSHGPQTIALTGAYTPLRINGHPRSLWRAHKVNDGDEIQIGYTAAGVRSYLAVAGGFIAPEWFGSASVVIRENLGRALQKGEVLEAETRQPASTRMNDNHQPQLCKSAVLRFITGYQWQQIPMQQRTKLTEHAYRVTPRFDRMGYQLEGAAIESGIEEIYSEGISRGTIQLPGHGQPIILMNDRQTIGGYPKLGAVISPDLDKLAQLGAGAEVRFEEISPEKAVEEYRKYREEIERVTITETRF